MGKETKIGLAVIGVLAVTFGGLLTRKVWLANSPQPAAHAPDRRVPAKPLTTAGMDKPTPVVTPLDEAAAHAAHQAREEAARHADHDLPPREYMPPRAPRADEMAESTIPTRHPVQNAVATEPATGNNPFRRGAVQTSAVEAADADTDIPDHQPREHQAAARSEAQDEPAPLRGAVRQAGATEPIDESTSEEPALAVPTADLDAAELAVEEEPTEQTEPIRLRASNTPPQHEEEQTPAEPAEQDFPAATPAPTRWHSAPAEPERVAPAAATTAMPENGKYTVGPNDTLSSISEKVYGTSSYFKALHEHNRNRMTHRDRLAVGTILDVPPVTTLEQNYPSLCPKQRRSAVVKPRTMPASTRQRGVGADNIYVVEEGDTLFDIARYELGKASRWAEIYELNRETLGEDFDYLRPGTELTLPAKSRATESFTKQPEDSRYQR